MAPLGAPVMIVVSGLAASGKTTVGRSIAAGLSLPLIDKDDILEALFDRLGCENREQRRRLSRASDEILFRLGSRLDNATWAPRPAPDAGGARRGHSPPARVMARVPRLSDAVVTVSTDRPVDIDALLTDVRASMARARQPTPSTG